MRLAEKLQELRDGAKERIPAEARAVMHRGVEALAASGVLERVLSVGQPAPAFALVNTEGHTVRSADRLQRGPLVVTFYRGVW